MFKDLSEEQKVHQDDLFLQQSLSTLSDEDRGLPQLKFIESLVSRGIGVHHGGLLPLVKEIIEILFSRGLIQVLFATETFAMGVNMPARSVMLTAINKHDGRRTRPLYSSEYIQVRLTTTAVVMAASIYSYALSS